jgi:cytochrome c-type biogenesis protein CcmH/NrfG
MNRDLFLGTAIGLAIGLLVAVLAFQVGRAGHLFQASEPVTAAPLAPPAQPGAAGVDAAEQIAAARHVVETDPKNVRAWIALGNLYYDSQQAQKAIEAYARALALQPGDPDVLTDQGVMFRAVGAYDKAVANFEKANRIAPGHLQSLYNLGVVQAFDLKNVAKAEEAWNRILQLAPESENAAQARRALAEVHGK